ncbi:tRNA-binding protein [archaeon]|nr:MAG: tRNA-binding protein [archaeon]
MIAYQDFEKVDIRVGMIVEADDFPEAKKPAFKLKIDFGELGVKRSTAQITKLYKKEELIGRQVIAVVNFPPKQVANTVSEVLTLGVPDKNGDIVLLRPDAEVEPGARMY